MTVNTFVQNEVCGRRTRGRTTKDGVWVDDELWVKAGPDRAKEEHQK